MSSKAFLLTTWCNVIAQNHQRGTPGPQKDGNYNWTHGNTRVPNTNPKLRQPAGAGEPAPPEEAHDHSWVAMSGTTICYWDTGCGISQRHPGPSSTTSCNIRAQTSWPRHHRVRESQRHPGQPHAYAICGHGPPHGLLLGHWVRDQPAPPRPNSLIENDVDTI